MRLFVICLIICKTIKAVDPETRAWPRYKQKKILHLLSILIGISCLFFF